jgi:hypothetical protein
MRIFGIRKAFGHSPWRRTDCRSDRTPCLSEERIGKEGGDRRRREETGGGDRRRREETGGGGLISHNENQKDNNRELL